MNTKHYVHIFVDTSEDAMTGDQGWGDIDEKDTVSKFGDLILKEACEMFPDVDVEVETYAPRQHVETDIDGDGQGTYGLTVAEEVQAIIERIYNDGEFWPK